MLHRHPILATLLLGVAALSFLPLLSAQESETVTREVRPFVPVTDEMLRDPAPGDWMMTHRTYDFQAYSPLDEINRDNVHRLQVAWMRAMDEGPQQTQPLVYDGVMYLANNNDHIQALDATTGDLLWDYQRRLPSDLREYATLGNRTRNLAIYGNHIYHLTGDAHLLALDARTGEVAFDREMADYRDGDHAFHGRHDHRRQGAYRTHLHARQPTGALLHLGPRLGLRRGALAGLHDGQCGRPGRADLG